MKKLHIIKSQRISRWYSLRNTFTSTYFKKFTRPLYVACNYDTILRNLGTLAIKSGFNKENDDRFDRDYTIRRFRWFSFTNVFLLKPGTPIVDHRNDINVTTRVLNRSMNTIVGMLAFVQFSG